MGPPAPPHALIVDDAPEMVALIAPLLRSEGYQVLTAADGQEAIDVARAHPLDLVVLDLTLPRLDGVDVCARLRTFSDVYVIMVTARRDEDAKVTGLSAGADDYLTKPFSPRELLARVQALRRRPRQASEAEDPVRRVGDLEVDLAGRRVRIAGEEVELTPIEMGLLAALVRDPAVTVDRQTLLEGVWGPDWYGDDHVVDVHVANLRRKLGDDPRAPRYVQTVRGVGYRMVAPA